MGLSLDEIRKAAASLPPPPDWQTVLAALGFSRDSLDYYGEERVRAAGRAVLLALMPPGAPRPSEEKVAEMIPALRELAAQVLGGRCVTAPDGSWFLVATPCRA